MAAHTDTWQTVSFYQTLSAVADPGFAGGRAWRARGARAYKRGYGAQPPAGFRGRTPDGESGGLRKLFVHFYTKKWPKVKDLSENLPPCLSRAAMTMTSLKFWSMGGRPPGPPIAGSATGYQHRHTESWLVSFRRIVLMLMLMLGRLRFLYSLP